LFLPDKKGGTLLAGVVRFFDCATAVHGRAVAIELEEGRRSGGRRLDEPAARKAARGPEANEGVDRWRARGKRDRGVDKDSRGGRGRKARQQSCNVIVALLTDKVTELLVDLDRTSEGKEHNFHGRWKSRKGAGCSAGSRDDGVVALIKGKCSELFVKDLALTGASFFWRWGAAGKWG
jgi:hypothetical protein